MYKCPNCFIEFLVLHETICHYKNCSMNRQNDMVYSNYRVPAYQQYKRCRGYRGRSVVSYIPVLKDCMTIKNVYLYSKLK